MLPRPSGPRSRTMAGRNMPRRSCLRTLRRWAAWITFWAVAALSAVTDAVAQRGRSVPAARPSRASGRHTSPTAEFARPTYRPARPGPSRGLTPSTPSRRSAYSAREPRGFSGPSAFPKCTPAGRSGVPPGDREPRSKGLRGLPQRLPTGTGEDQRPRARPRGPVRVDPGAQPGRGRRRPRAAA